MVGQVEEVVGQNLNITPYPRMLYRAGSLENHAHGAQTLKMQGFDDVEYTIVNDETEELEHLEQGWTNSIAKARQDRNADAIKAAEDRETALRAKGAEQSKPKAA